MMNAQDPNQRETALARLLAMHAALQNARPVEGMDRSPSTNFSSSSNGSASVSRSNTTGSPGSELQVHIYPPANAGKAQLPDPFPHMEKRSFNEASLMLTSTGNNRSLSGLDSPTTTQYNLWDSNPLAQGFGQATHLNSALVAFVEQINRPVANNNTSPSSLMSTKESVVNITTLNQQPTDTIPAYNPGSDNAAWGPSAYPQPRVMVQRDLDSICAQTMPTPVVTQQVVNRGGASATSAIQDLTASSASLYVKNLPPEFDELALYQTFAPYGALLSCKIALDPTTNKCKGVGFVNFVERECALRAMAQLHGVRIAEGRNLHLALQAPKAVRNGGAPGVPGLGSFANPTSAGSSQPQAVIPSAANGWYIVA